MTNAFLLLVVAAFASFRITRLIVWDDGPFDIIYKFRVWIGVYDYSENGTIPKTGLGKLFGCPYCVGIWVSLFFALALFELNSILLLYWLAIAGGQSLLQAVVDRT